MKKKALTFCMALMLAFSALILPILSNSAGSEAEARRWGGYGYGRGWGGYGRYGGWGRGNPYRFRTYGFNQWNMRSPCGIYGNRFWMGGGRGWYGGNRRWYNGCGRGWYNGGYYYGPGYNRWADVASLGILLGYEALSGGLNIGGNVDMGMGPIDVGMGAYGNVYGSPMGNYLPPMPNIPYPQPIPYPNYPQYPPYPPIPQYPQYPPYPNYPQYPPVPNYPQYPRVPAPQYPCPPQQSPVPCQPACKSGPGYIEIEIEIRH